MSQGPSSGVPSRGSAASRSPPSFQAREPIEVWSRSAKAWLPGRVEEVFAADCVADGFSVPAGCVKVSSPAGLKYVLPSEAVSTLRRPPAAGRADAAEGPGPASAAPRSRPAARGRCSRERLAARDDWNTSEIKVQELFAAYDRDGSRALEPEEFRALLRDFNDGRPPSDQELGFMLGLCDKDHDGTISVGELHYALRAWHSYCHLDDSLLSLFAEFDADESGRLDAGELKELLTAMNGGTPVPWSEVEYVMERSNVLGDGAIHRSELLGSVAAWYAHVDRAGTDIPTLVREAVARTAKQGDQSEALGDGRRSLGHVASVMRGDLEGYLHVGDNDADATGGLSAATPHEDGAQTSMDRAAGELPSSSSKWSKAAPLLTRTCSKLCYVAFPFLVGWVVACSGWNLRDNDCPRNLDGVLLWFGLLVILLAALAYARGPDVTVRAARAATAVTMVLLNLIGFLWARDGAVQQNMRRCGRFLVYWSMFVWTVVPLAAIVYALYQVAAHLKRLRHHDQRLQKEVLL